MIGRGRGWLNLSATSKSSRDLASIFSLPTRVYSAGMQARLACALATMQSPDILLIDEIAAVEG
jgi:ABC-type polysaccharide/polyol phosphate transport system ATPase subunit